MWGTIKHLHYLHSAGVLKITNELVNEIYSVFWEGVRKKA
jgi:hypothetical protein